jgi:hypothetical protein
LAVEELEVYWMTIASLKEASKSVSTASIAMAAMPSVCAEPFALAFAFEPWLLAAGIAALAPAVCGGRTLMATSNLPTMWSNSAAM